MSMLFLTLISSLLSFLQPGSANSFLVEAEDFADAGGWVLDEQFYEQVGSAYLLAHGAGTPVADASTTISFPSAGRYHVWVRTYNWIAPWNSNHSPGLFCIKADGKQIGGILGNEPDAWGWQYAGAVKAKGGPVSLSLHDLTGFEGRCDAIFFSRDRNPKFPEVREYKRTESQEMYDLIVVGAGYSGISAAVAASRSGLKVLLLDNKAHLGGNSSPEVGIIASGRTHEGRYPNLGNVIAEYGLAYRNYRDVESKLAGEENITVLLRHRVTSVQTFGNSISKVVAVDFTDGVEKMFRGRLFADCSGDANLGYLAGAEWMSGQETRQEYGESLAPETPDGRSYGSSLNWKSVKGESSFPVLPWAIPFTDETVRDVAGYKAFEGGFGMDQIGEAERIRDYLLLIIYSNWSYLKNAPSFKEKYSTLSITAQSVPYTLGKRESRRLKGDVVFTQNDIYGGWENYPDAAVWATYPIDQHFPSDFMTEHFPGVEFEFVMQHNFNPRGVSRSKLVQGRDYPDPYMIPYRCLYSRNIDNMFMAGRNISGSRIAFCSYRVAGTGALMGEVVGLAASLCIKYDCTPREIYTDHLAELLESLKKGVPSKYARVYTAN